MRRLCAAKTVSSNDATTRSASYRGLEQQVRGSAIVIPANSSRRMDVTNLVRQELSRGASVVKADNAWAGRDPALGTRKQLFVVIKLPSGQEQQLKS